MYNVIGKRVNSTIMGPDKTVYDRDYVIDYTSVEWNDLVEYNEGHYQWQWEQADSEESATLVHELYHLYNAVGERVQVTANRFSQWGGENILYKRNVHEDIMGSAVYYTQQDTGILRINMSTPPGATIPRRPLIIMIRNTVPQSRTIPGILMTEA